MRPGAIRIEKRRISQIHDIGPAVNQGWGKIGNRGSDQHGCHSAITLRSKFTGLTQQFKRNRMHAFLLLFGDNPDITVGAKVRRGRRRAFRNNRADPAYLYAGPATGAVVLLKREPCHQA